MPDYYSLLEVDVTADANTIKAAYRKLALTYHPDRNRDNPEAEEKFKAINEAYAVLSDPEKRARYDRFGTVEGGVPLGGDIFDIFASVFGTNFGSGFGSRPRQQGHPGEDLEAELKITLEQARDGATVPVEIERLAVCHHCNGERAEPGSGSKKTCDRCGGAGQVQVQAQSFFGTVVTTRACPTCHGDGEIITDPCRVCNGRGREISSDTIDVTLPRGIDGGYRLRVPREGNAGVGGAPAGDLYLYLELEPHPYLERAGDDLHHELEVGMAQAAIGGSFSVPTLDGEEAVTLPAGTQPGAQFRLKGKGMPRLRQVGHGDEVISVKVVIPKELSPKAREHLQAYAEEVGEELSSTTTVTEKVKGFFQARRKRGAAAKATDGGEVSDEDREAVGS